MALFSQYAIAAAEEALDDAGLLGIEEKEKDMTVGTSVNMKIAYID